MSSSASITSSGIAAAQSSFKSTQAKAGNPFQGSETAGAANCSSCCCVGSEDAFACVSVSAMLLTMLMMKYCWILQSTRKCRASEEENKISATKRSKRFRDKIRDLIKKHQIASNDEACVSIAHNARHLTNQR